MGARAVFAALSAPLSWSRPINRVERRVSHGRTTKAKRA